MAKKDELLVCNCEDDANHIMYTDNNQETVVECTQCKRALKFSKDDHTAYAGKVKKITQAERQELAHAEKSVDTGKMEKTLLGE